MFVYKITNTVTDRVYVGLTTCSLQKRWREHKCAANLGSNKPLYRAMRKHGVENFSIHLLYTATSIEDMRAAEIRYIVELKAHAAENGYNLTDHGYAHGKANQPVGEKAHQAKLTEEMVAFIRDPVYWNVSNTQLLAMVEEQFGFVGARDTIRDARRGDRWKHLNDKYPPVKARQGSRQPSMSEEQRASAIATLKTHHAEAVRKAAELRKTGRQPNARLSEQEVKDIFYSPLSLLKTASQFGISKKMVLNIKHHRAHTYLTKDL